MLASLLGKNDLLLAWMRLSQLVTVQGVFKLPTRLCGAGGRSRYLSFSISNPGSHFASRFQTPASHLSIPQLDMLSHVKEDKIFPGEETCNHFVLCNRAAVPLRELTLGRGSPVPYGAPTKRR